MYFKQFKEELQNRLLAEAESKLDGTIEFAEMMKNGRIQNGIIYRPAGSRIGITTYVEKCYEAYQEGYPMEKIVEDYVPAMINHSQDVEVDYDRLVNALVPENIVPALIPRKGNEEMLETVPHVPFQNLEVIFKFNIPEFFGGGMANVSGQFSEQFGFDAEELLDIAMNNMKGQTVVTPLPEILYGSGKSDTDWDSLKNGEKTMLVLSNRSNFHGAASILDKEIMIKIVDVFEEDVYILPSSIHECIVVPQSMGPAEDLQKMVKSANQDVVAPEDWLSDDIYVFDSRTQEMTLVDEVPEKSEQQMHTVPSPSVR